MATTRISGTTTVGALDGVTVRAYLASRFVTDPVYDVPNLADAEQLAALGEPDFPSVTSGQEWGGAGAYIIEDIPPGSDVWTGETFNGHTVWQLHPAGGGGGGGTAEFTDTVTITPPLTHPGLVIELSPSLSGGYPSALDVERDGYSVFGMSGGQGMGLWCTYEFDMYNTPEDNNSTFQVWPGGMETTLRNPSDYVSVTGPNGGVLEVTGGGRVWTWSTMLDDGGGNTRIWGGLRLGDNDGYAHDVLQLGSCTGDPAPQAGLEGDIIIRRDAPDIDHLIYRCTAEGRASGALADVGGGAYKFGSGSTSYEYKVIPIIRGQDAVGDDCPLISVTSQVATLDADHYNSIYWQPTPGAEGYRVVRTLGGPSQGWIQYCEATTCGYDDHGATAYSWTPGTGAAVWTPLPLSVGLHVFTGSGVPSNGMGADGDTYHRTDTPGVTNQRMYVKSAGSWVGVV